MSLIFSASILHVWLNVPPSTWSIVGGSSLKHEVRIATEDDEDFFHKFTQSLG